MGQWSGGCYSEPQFSISIVAADLQNITLFHPACHQMAGQNVGFPWLITTLKVLNFAYAFIFKLHFCWKLLVNTNYKLLNPFNIVKHSLNIIKAKKSVITMLK